MQNIWYKNAVFYCVDVETFMDGNGDGIGDFKGLTDRLDYIAGLGATCIWLLPFFKTPNRDNGYDISDYYSVDPRLGSLGDFVNFMQLARERGLRVIIDLVVNHTSIDHPWFQEAVKDENSPMRSWYLWSKEKPHNAHEGMVFPGQQETTWTWHEEAQAYYFHRFYDFSPDLNPDNPDVREEIQKIMGFWLELGVSGFRMDAAPFVIESLKEEYRFQRHYEWLEDMRAFMSWRRGDAALLAEANVTADEVPDYVGEGDRMNLMFNFIVNQRLFLCLARNQATELRKVMRTLPSMPLRAQWANFLRNHDELDLGRLEPEELEECFRAFAPDESMRLYGRGIRRRLASMLDNDRKRLELVFSLLFTLPGSPVIWYGDEIGMGDLQNLPDRFPVRTPMQWSAEENGGFSAAPADKLVRPVISKGPFGFDKVNVQHQRRDRQSLLNWVEAASRVRRESPELGWGELTVLDAGTEAVLAHTMKWQEGRMVLLHNFSPKPQKVRLEGLDEDVGSMHDVYCDQSYDGEDKMDPEKPISLNGYGYRWMRTDGTRR
ncbi:alpha-amylase family protein [Indioceanicola profundi]|uniref:alpha-amylase family protein n=1 Tax=Indioceanicola profundi TaxID=2220096 RepID=UPI000E6AB9F8|nr:alpha-amylase family protein [Indioceanicola profundi]